MSQGYQLANLTHRLIQTCETPEKHPGVAGDLCAFFADMTGLTPPSTAPINTEGTQLDTGLALSPPDASLCLFDATRTVRFITGIYRAVKRLARETGHVHVLYAGTGPFAPLALPILSCVAPGQVQFTLIDIHKEAICCVRRLVEKLGLQKGIRAYHCEDAAQYRHPQSVPVHLVIVETMQNALNQEPQVAVTRNLATQLPINVPFIPKRVTIRATLRCSASTKKNIPLGRVFNLTPNTFHPSKTTAPSHDRIPAGIIQIPRNFHPGQHLQLLTQIQVSSTVSLNESECDLTTPAPFPEGPPFYPGDRLAFHYEISAYPQFKYRILT